MEKERCAQNSYMFYDFGKLSCKEKPLIFSRLLTVMEK
jgi:hypothetical protein